MASAICGQAPPTVIARYDPNPMWHPAAIPSLKIFAHEAEALAEVSKHNEQNSTHQHERKTTARTGSSSDGTLIDSSRRLEVGNGNLTSRHAEIDRRAVDRGAMLLSI